MANKVSLFIPFKHQITKLVLIGDHKQLVPSINFERNKINYDLK